MIGSFIAENNIDMTDCGGEFENFAQFFARRKKGVRFPAQADLMGSPCEGFASAFENIDPSAMIAAKGCKYSLDELFGAPGDSAAADLAQRYAGGVCLRLRLTPADYHRMHFFDAGEVADATYIDGDLYSVSPIAVKKIARLYCRNKRVRVELSTENFGYVTIVEVGATFVGSIVHKFLVGDIARRGREASYFLPGGSLVLIFFEKGKISPDEGILTRTCDNIETRVKVGEVIGRRFNR
jgi:phosphatidylserine decarboxylase